MVAATLKTKRPDTAPRGEPCRRCGQASQAKREEPNALAEFEPCGMRTACRRRAWRQRFPEESVPDDRPGRKPVAARKVLDAILWIPTPAQWHMMPQYYPNYKTVRRRFQQWCANEVFRSALMSLTNALREQGAKIMAIVDRHGLPLAVSTHAANHHEVALVQLCADQLFDGLRFSPSRQRERRRCHPRLKQVGLARIAD
jgi:Putative transposase of IS4/5 family (DUF4096)